MIDVREPCEWAIARLPGARSIPLDALPGALPSLDPDVEHVVYCHHGMRSAAAADWLGDQAFLVLATSPAESIAGASTWTR